MRASLSKSDNAFCKLTSLLNGRFKRHHSIDDEYPMTASAANDEKKIHVDLMPADHRVPLENNEKNSQQIPFEKSLLSEEIVVSRRKKNTMKEIFLLSIESGRLV